MANPDDTFRESPAGAGKQRYLYLAVVLIAAAIYLGCILSPPSLMDDVDAVQAQIARNMLTSGDWVTARIDGIIYLEKSPLIYWLIAISYKIFGAFDWAARIPGGALVRVAGVAHGGFRHVGVRPARGLLRRAVHGHLHRAVPVYADSDSRRDADRDHRALHVGLPARAGRRGAASALLGLRAGREPGRGAAAEERGGAAVPRRGGAIYLLFTRQLFSRKVWKRLRPWSGLAIILLIAAPWHVLATLRNPPYFDFTMRSVPGEYHGFLWFYFINEQVLRFLNLRYPRDYNTVPRVYFWLFHLLWLFPWSVYFPAVARAVLQAAGPRRADAPAGALLDRLSAGVLHFLHHAGVLFDAVLSGAGAAAGFGDGGGRRLGAARHARAGGGYGLRGLACLAILVAVRNVPTPGDISQALSRHPGAYTLSLGHMEDLTLESFAYLRLPLAIAAVAFRNRRGGQPAGRGAARFPGGGA